MISIKLNMITRGAMSLALIFVFFSMFKGVTNILNAFLIPLTLYISSINQNTKQIFTLYFAVIIFCFLFFNVQFFFIIFYCFIAFLLTKLCGGKVNIVLSALILTITISFSFWIAIILTDNFLLTHMNEIIMKVLRGNTFAYTLMLIVEGSLVGVSQLFISRMLYKRISTIKKDNLYKAKVSI